MLHTLIQSSGQESNICGKPMNENVWKTFTHDQFSSLQKRDICISCQVHQQNQLGRTVTYFVFIQLYQNGNEYILKTVLNFK